MVFTLSQRKHHRKENIVTVSAYILNGNISHKLSKLYLICTSTTIYQIYFGESPSTYKNNTDWTGVV